MGDKSTVYLKLMWSFIFQICQAKCISFQWQILNFCYFHYSSTEKHCLGKRGNFILKREHRKISTWTAGVPHYPWLNFYVHLATKWGLWIFYPITYIVSTFESDPLPVLLKIFYFSYGRLTVVLRQTTENSLKLLREKKGDTPCMGVN